MLSRNRAAFLNSILVGLIVLLVSAPWWLTVIHYHGIAPLLKGAATGQKTLAVFHLLFFVFTEEPYATLLAVLGLIGIAHQLVHKDYLLPLWMVIPFLVEGRSAPGPAAIPLAMLAAIGLVEVVFKALRLGAARNTATGRSELGENDGKTSDPIPSAERNFMIYVVLYLIFSTYQFGFQLSSATLYLPDRIAMNWVHDNTPRDARFLVLTGTSSVSCDSVLEWFPALTGRQSLLTVQGTEWTQGAHFNQYVRSTYAVQECLSAGDTACLDTAAPPSAYDFIYLSKQLRADNCKPLAVPRTFPSFLEHMRQDSSLHAVYETDGVVIFGK